MDDDEYLPEEYLPEEYNPATTSQDTEYKYVWDQEMVFSLIDEYRNHLQDFLFPQGTMIRDVWENISRNMKARGYDLSAASCDNKWRQLKKTFRVNMPNRGRKDGRYAWSKSKWIFYDALEDILGNKEIANRLVWKQRSTIKREREEPDSPPSYYTQEDMLEDEDTEQEPKPAKRAKLEEPPKWFENFLTQYQEEEKEKRKALQKMHTDLVALEKQKCILLENLIKKIPKSESVPKIVDAVSLSQEVFEDEL